MQRSPYASGLELDADSARASGVRRVLERIFGRHLFHAVLLVLAPVLIAQSFSSPIAMLRDPDIWWHLADARSLFQHLQFIHVDSYTFSVAGKLWVNPEWLSEIPYWAGYRLFELRGVYLVSWLAVAANVLFLYWRSCRRSGNSSASFAAAGLGFLLMTVNSGPRTILFAYLALSIELAILEEAERGRARMVWFLPALFCIWINLHGSWIIGMGLLIVYIACGMFGCETGAIGQHARAPREQRRLLTVLCGSVLALMINPYGWRLIWNPIDMMFNQKLNIGNVEEWQHLDLGSARGMTVALAIVAMVLANVLRGRKWKLYELVFIVFAWFAALDHARFCFLAAVVTTPLLAVDVARSFLEPERKATIPAVNAMFLVAVAGFMMYRFPREAELQRDYRQLYPIQTIAKIQPSWRTFNAANLGGVLAFEQKPSYLDTRFDIFEHEGIFATYLDIVGNKQSLELLDAAHFDHVLVPAPTSLAYLLRHTNGWREVAREGSGADTFVLFTRVRNP